ncbi:MAG: ABC1 kinase family protein [Jiangellaceae bacterium]
MDALTVLSVAGYLVFWTLLLSLIARRFLDLRAGPLRLLLSGAAGLTVAALAVGPQMRNEEQQAGFILLWIGIGVLSAMGLLNLSETFLSAGTRPRLVHWYRAFRRWRRRASRYSQISRIAVRHGLGAYLSGRREPTRQQRAGLARRLRLALDEAGVCFVKLGQILSTRPDVLPKEFIDELSRLQSQAAPVEWAEIEILLGEELGSPVTEVFADVDRQPLAAASIAQVHRARLRAGDQVVVKLQRPGIRPIVEADLDIMVRMATVLHERAQWARSIGVRDLADGFVEALREELDFTVEARNMASVIAARSYDDVAISRVHTELCTSRVLVMDFLDGLPLDKAAPIIDDLGLDRTDLARRLLHTLLTQIMLDGVFLADPHPGNLLLLRDGRLGLLDFGSVGRLDANLRGVLQRLLLAVDTGDATALSDALVEAVDRPEEIDEAGLTRAVGRFMARHLGPGLAVDVEMFADLFRLVTRYGVSVPPELAAVFRALATAEGTLSELAPGFDIVEESRTFATTRLRQAVLPESLRATATAELVKLLPVIRRVPRRLDRITSAIEHGRLSTEVRLFADERDRRVVTRLVHQSLLTILAAATGVVAAILLGTAGGPQVAQDLGLYQLIAYTLLIVSGALTLRVLTSMLRAE